MKTKADLGLREGKEAGEANGATVVQEDPGAADNRQALQRCKGHASFNGGIAGLAVTDWDGKESR